MRRGGNTPVLDAPVGAFNFILNERQAIVTPGDWEKIALDEGNAYVVARLDDGVTVELGGEEYSPSSGATFTPLIACFDHTLELRWAQTPLRADNGQGEDFPLRLHAAHGSVYLGQSFTHPHDFGGNPIDAGGFIASLAASDGTVTWARGVGWRTPAISTTGDQVYFAGSGLGASIDIGGGSFGDASGSDILIGVLQRSGTYESARVFGGLNRIAECSIQGY